MLQVINIFQQLTAESPGQRFFFFFNGHHYNRKQMSLNLLWRGKKRRKMQSECPPNIRTNNPSDGGRGGEKKSQRPHRTTTRQTDEEFHSLTSQQTNNNWQMQDADLVRVFAVRLPSECHACLPLPKFAIASQFHSVRFPRIQLQLQTDGQNTWTPPPKLISADAVPQEITRPQHFFFRIYRKNSRLVIFTQTTPSIGWTIHFLPSKVTRQKNVQFDEISSVRSSYWTLMTGNF